MKANLYSHPQEALVIFNPGTGPQVYQEIQDIIAKPYLKTKYTPLCTLSENSIKLSSISLFTLAEVLTRSQRAHDLRLIVTTGKVYFENSFKKLCESIAWNQYLVPKTKIRVRVKSFTSHLFHEAMLKERVAEYLLDKAQIEVPKTDEEKALTTLYVELRDNKCTFSLSLAGEALYQRGFREISKAVAPLREDIAQTCIQRALKFCQQLDSQYQVRNLWVPFGGTGTFIFEYLMGEMKIAPCLLGRSYALQSLVFFNEKNFRFIQQKAKAQIEESHLEKIVYIDHAEEAMQSFNKNQILFAQKIREHFPSKDIQNSTLSENIFAPTDYNFKDGSIFVPLNPPYGLRLHSQADILELYKRIASKLIAIAKGLDPQQRLGGFILCPSEQTWSIFASVLQGQGELETYHLTQGGLDIRVCQFLLS